MNSFCSANISRKNADWSHASAHLKYKLSSSKNILLENVNIKIIWLFEYTRFLGTIHKKEKMPCLLFIVPEEYMMFFFYCLQDTEHLWHKRCFWRNISASNNKCKHWVQTVIMLWFFNHKTDGPPRMYRSLETCKIQTKKTMKEQQEKNILNNTSCTLKWEITQEESWRIVWADLTVCWSHKVASDRIGCSIIFE